MDPVVFDESCVAAIRDAAERLGEPSLELISGAGHDAVYVARSTPAAMLFIPCRDGVSHSPAEHAEPEHVRAGADVLLHAVLDRAGVSRGPRPAPSAA
jgi:N-carbamoyl-L-amino-acid hydrolase